MKIISTVSILYLLVALGHANDDLNDNKFPSDKLNQDLSFLMKSIDEIHPNLYFQISKEEALIAYQEIEANLTEPLTSLEFYNRINPFVDSFEDVHTDVQRPVTTEVDLSEGHKSTSDPKQDSLNWSFEIIEDEIGYLNFVRMIKRTEFDTFLEETFQLIKEQNIKGLIIDLRKNHGGNSNLGVALLNYITDKPYREIGGGRWRFSNQFVSIFPQRWSEIWQDEPPTGLKDFLASELPQFATDALSQNPTNKLKLLLADDAPEWLKEFFRENAPHWLDSNYSPETETEIIAAEFGQLRHPTIEYPLRYTGPVCFLISNETYSSAIILGNAVEDYKLATLIGEETSPANQFGETYGFNLPNTQLYVSVSCVQFLRANGDASNPRGVLPHYEVRHDRTPYFVPIFK